MANKTLKRKVQAEPEKSAFVTPVMDSAKELFFAGLGVFSVAQQERNDQLDLGHVLSPTGDFVVIHAACQTRQTAS